ncbi:MAG: twin-arginine translocase TatA/TatE family subunit [Bacteroidales bacterium]
MIAFFNRLGTGELIVIALIILLLFGGKKIPELMRGLGKGVREFKDASSKMKDEFREGESGKDDSSAGEEKKEEKKAD